MAGGRTAAAQAGAGAIAAEPPPFASAEAVKLWLSERFARETDPERILRTAAAAVGEFLGAARVGYGEFEADATRIAIPLDWARPGLASIAGVHGFDPDSQIGRRLREGRLVVIDDIGDFPDIRDRAGPLAVGTSQAFIVVPLLNDGRPVAVFVATSERPRAWTQDEITLVSQTGARIWGALQHLRLTEQLRESEEQFRMMAENLPGICWVGDRDAKPLWGNRRWHAMYDDTAAAHGDARDAIHPDDLPRARAMWKDMRAEGTPGEFQLRLRGADGIFRPFLSKAAPIRDTTGAVTRWVGVQIDLSDQLAQNRRQLVLRSFYDATRALTDPAAILAAMSRLVVAHLDVPYFLYFEAAGARAQLAILESGEGAPFAGPDRAALDAAFLALANRPGWTETRVIDDERDTPKPPDDPIAVIARLMQVRAGVNVPIVKHDRRVAAMTVLDVTPRHWTPDEIGLIEDLSEALWTTIARARAEAELKDRERSQAFLIEWTDALRGERAPDRIVAVTLARLGRHFGINRTTYSLGDETGNLLTNRGEWADGVISVADTVWRLDDVDPDVRRQWLRGEPVHYDDIPNDPRITAARRAFFESVSVRSLVTIPLIENGLVRSALSLQSKVERRWTPSEIQLLCDVAERTWVVLERARAEAELATRERNQAFLIDWSDRIRGEAEPARIIAETLAALGPFLGVNRATFAALDPAAEATFEVTSEWRDGVGSLLGNRFTLPSVGAAVDRDWHAGETIRFDDVAADPRLEPAALERYHRNRIGAFVSVPLVAGGTMQSALSFQSAAPRVWTEGEVQLLRDVAERTWVALERAQGQAALAERSRHQAFLVAWNDMVRGEARARVILAHTVRMLGKHLGVTCVNYSEPDAAMTQMTVIEEYHAPDAIGVKGTTYPMTHFGEPFAAEQRRGGPVRVDDIATDPRFDTNARTAFAAVGVGAILTLPMKRGREVLAILSAQHRVRRTWTDAEIELARDLADRTLAVLERAQSEARLAESEAQLSAILQHAPVAMNLRDAQGRYIRLNPEFGRAVHRPVEELTGLMPTDIFPPHVADQIMGMHRRAMSGEVASLELMEGEGKYESVLTIAFPIGDGQGAAKTAGFTIDLSERKKAEAALQKSRDTLYQTEKLTALGSLLAGVSHELNNPLSIVVAQAVMMERQSQGGELAERAQKIRKAADRCARIVQSFLAMARQKRPEREAVDLNAIAMAAHELADYGLKNDGIATLRALAPNLPPISADSDQLHQIVINLIVNAQQAMVEGTAKDRVLTLRSGPGERPGTVMLEVADTGPGVPLEVQRRIFEPFYTTKPQGQGTGVGLSFSQGLAEAHGGTLELVPAKVGACFRLTLPIDADAALPAVATKLDLAPPAPARRALVIDDEREIAESLADFLSLEGFRCEIAAGGIAARELLDEGDFDLIVSDLRMPDLDGPSLYAWLTGHRPDLSGRIAFATGDTLGQTAARFLSGLQRPVLEKPFTPEAVRRFLEQMDLA